MTRDELIAQAIRITAAVAHGDGCAPAVVADARVVSYALIEQALAAGAAADPLERKRANSRDRSQRLRDRKRDASARVTPDDTPASRTNHAGERDDSVTERDSERDDAPSDSPISDQDLLSSLGDHSEKREEKSASAPEPHHALSRIERDASEPHVSRETLDEPLDDDALYGDGTPGPYERPEGKLAAQLIRVWERVVCGGNPIGETSEPRRQLEALQPALLARCGGKPVEFFERVLKPYTARKREKKRIPLLYQFCNDFAGAADQLALDEQAATLPPGAPVADRIRSLRRVWFEARLAIWEAAKRGDDGARANATIELSRARVALIAVNARIDTLEDEFEAEMAKREAS